MVRWTFQALLHIRFPLNDDYLEKVCSLQSSSLVASFFTESAVVDGAPVGVLNL
jgi:hypothetical protein